MFEFRVEGKLGQASQDVMRQWVGTCKRYPKPKP